MTDDNSKHFEVGSPAHAPKTAKRVLLVEDYAPNILVATTFIQQFGYEYEVAINGLQAIDKVRGEAFGAILMDVQMHGMNGLEATRTIREVEEQQQRKPVTIIGMTAHALAGDKERCLNAGMDDYITKPFVPDDLKNKLHDAFEKRD